MKRMGNFLPALLGTLLLASIGHGQFVSRLEYFFDNDPGLGHGISVPIVSDTVVNVTLQCRSDWFDNRHPSDQRSRPE